MRVPVIPLVRISKAVPFGSCLAFVLLFRVLFEQGGVTFFGPFDDRGGGVDGSLSFYFMIFTVIVCVGNLGSDVLGRKCLASILSQVLTTLALVTAYVGIFCVVELIVGSVDCESLVCGTVMADTLVLSFSILFARRLCSFNLLVARCSIRANHSSNLFSNKSYGKLTKFLYLVISFLFIGVQLYGRGLGVRGAVVVLLFIVAIFSATSQVNFLALMKLITCCVLFLRSGGAIKQGIFFAVIVIVVMVMSSSSILSLILREVGRNATVGSRIVDKRRNHSTV